MAYSLITMHDETFEDLAKITLDQNKKKYCEFWDYKLFSKTDGFGKNKKTIYFDKLRFILETLDRNPDIDWGWWLDCDAMITDFNTDIERWCDNNYHIVIAYDRLTINNGSFFIRNTSEGKGYIRHSLSLEEEYETETGAMELLAKQIGYRDIIKIHSQRDFNSYDYDYYKTLYNITKHPMYENVSSIDLTGKDGNWKQGDFVCHWPGMTNDHKIKLATEMLLLINKGGSILKHG